MRKRYLLILSIATMVFQGGCSRPSDPNSTIYKYKVACNQGYGLKCYYLGKMYEHGVDVDKNNQYAIYNYRRGCELGDRKSCDKLKWFSKTKNEKTKYQRKNIKKKSIKRFKVVKKQKHSKKTYVPKRTATKIKKSHTKIHKSISSERHEIRATIEKARHSKRKRYENKKKAVKRQKKDKVIHKKKERFGKVSEKYLHIYFAQ